MRTCLLHRGLCLTDVVCVNGDEPRERIGAFFRCHFQFAPVGRQNCIILFYPGGGWTVIQRRIDGTVPFNRNWEEYKRGFGNKDGEHWLGNDNIHLLTNQKDYRLQLFTNNMALTCSRGFFKVSDERNDYRPDHGKGKPNSNCDRLIKDTFGQAFSTVDRDNDNVQTMSCAKLYGGGWWYGYCGPTTFLNQQWDCARNPKCCPCAITVKPMSLKLKP
ncbi:ficolin-2-like [Branchiostoma floridae x Branchiostoma belcheri]